MTPTVELSNQKESPFNPGKIIEVDGWPRWKTHVGPFELTLDIVSVAQLEEEKEIGIASFVVMEQEQPFLNYVGNLLAEAIHHQLPERKIVLLTAESKGCHFIPWVWKNLAEMIGNKLQDRIITFRKGQKVYMRREARINNQAVVLSKVEFYSITSPKKQTLAISPRDVEFLFQAIEDGAEPVPVDDFIGRGGTIVAISRLGQQLGLEPPNLLAVVGSDGNLYEQTFKQEGIDIKLLPRPFPLILPTFERESPEAHWKVREF